MRMRNVTLCLPEDTHRRKTSPTRPETEMKIAL
jgi:hypothetical protein